MKNSGLTARSPPDFCSHYCEEGEEKNGHKKKVKQIKEAPVTHQSLEEALNAPEQSEEEKPKKAKKVAEEDKTTLL
jgi:hypothetical protein